MWSGFISFALVGSCVSVHMWLLHVYRLTATLGLQLWKPECIQTPWKSNGDCSMPCLRGAITWVRELLQSGSGQSPEGCNEWDVKQYERCGTETCMCEVSAGSFVSITSSEQSNSTALDVSAVPVIKVGGYDDRLQLKFDQQAFSSKTLTQLWFSVRQEAAYGNQPEPPSWAGSCDKMVNFSDRTSVIIEPNVESSGIYTLDVCAIQPAVFPDPVICPCMHINSA